jgi:hypothetical protein
MYLMSSIFPHLQLQSHPKSVPSTNAAIPWSSTTGTQPTSHVITSANVQTELRTDSYVPQTLNSIQSNTFVSGLKMPYLVEEDQQKQKQSFHSYIPSIGSGSIKTNIPTVMRSPSFPCFQNLKICLQ